MTAANANKGETPSGKSPLVIKDVPETEKATVIKNTIASLGDSFVTYREEKQANGNWTLIFYFVDEAN
jgi:hypothetical protein